jgi:predicted O-linked N-acetylglucosamine transferase (SPINDLY family)
MMTPFTATKEEHLACYGHLDISLDTFPYNGTTTTCESLWMGVPVVGVLGNRHASRVTASILTRLELDSLVAKDAEECVEIVVHLAGKPELLQALRFGLRDKMRNSNLCNGNRFFSELGAAYRQMWQKWCLGDLSTSK